MSRLAIPLGVDDLSTFAKSLGAALRAHDGVPSHVELLNMLARSAGFANFQQLRADAEAADRLMAAADPGADIGQVEKTARYFDDDGVLVSWPSRFAHQTLSQWVFWSRIPRGETYDERGISALIKGWHAFGDHAIIRRAMVDAKMLERNQNGREYRRIEQVPPPELGALLAHLEQRKRAA